jgi:hypothetical protein
MNVHAETSCPPKNMRETSHLLEALLSRLPVNDVPNRLEVFSLAVLVIEAVTILAHKNLPTVKQYKTNLLVRMLPRINTENRTELSNDRILVRIRPNLHATRLRILDQPRPPTSLDTRQRRVKLLLERIQTSIAVVDSGSQLARRRLAATLAGGRQVLPEQAVVDVAAAVEVDHWLQGDLSSNVLFLLGFGDLLAEVVERGYVGVVVVLVVEFHDFA